VTETTPIQTQVRHPGALAREVHIELSSAHVDGVAGERLARLRKTVRVNGFRPGHVPLREVERRHGAQVRGEVVGDLLQNAVAKAMQEHALRPASTPELEPAPQEGDTGVLRFIARFEVFPDITLADFGQHRITVPKVEIGDADVDQAIERLRAQRAQWNAVERPAQAGDRVVVSFEGTLDGEAFEGGSATDARMTVGAGTLLPEFEAALPGIAAGEARSFELTFPADYPRAPLAGRTAHFELRCGTVEEATLPALDDAFASELGVQEGGIEALRTQVRQTLEAQAQRQVRLRRKNAVMELLLAHHAFDLPASLVHAEAHQLAHRSGAAAHGDHAHGDDAHEAEVVKFEPQAASRVKLGLVLAEIARVAQLKADPALVRQEVDAIARRFDDPEQVTRWYYADPQRLQDIQNGVLEEQLVNWVAERVRVEEQPITFAELAGAAA
jgi:trigger factor